MSLSLAALGAIEHAINYALKQDLPSQRHLAKLAGQQIFLEVEDFNLILQIHVLDEGVMLDRPSSMTEVELDTKLDTHVKGPSGAYRKLLEGDGFFDGDLRIRGNAQALMTLHKVMQGFEFDWEGILADKVGDLPAASFARLIRTQWSASKTLSTNARAHFVNYLQSNSELLPSKIEFDHFVDEAERLGMKIDRLDARLKQIARKRS
ncbi:hypothetical protein DN730_14710 [Marinomonas piezotolerans]|uniref:Ubiquinone biosynthesis accessory factor UbiJ n=1 Tax=Marinomonas piezotolerans TaxID=2213058 RepID=A0A370U621_9GAMM|nr:SCP2 sterol-binding domain-containing protein [Marinomonas piezotolerans]RDL43227.1 hypothetical protein DN730_14710 [Marinomonas piezotolerans]